MRSARPRALTGGLIAAAALVAGALPAAALPTRASDLFGADPASVAAPAEPSAFVTRPDLTPPVVRTDRGARGTEPGHIFLSPRGTAAQSGPMILDEDGQPVWSQPVGDGAATFAADFKPQTYRGQPVLTWWQGAMNDHSGSGTGEYVIMDQHYQQIGTVRAGNGLPSDLHDMVITPRDTALITSYPVVQTDRAIIDSVVQEIDIATGEVLFEWRASDHVGLDESTMPAPADPAMPFDFFHINSVHEDAAGNLLVSARHTDALYQIDRATGQVAWRLGGTRSDFPIPEEARFARQHDARWLPNGQISVFDNAAGEPGPASRGLLLDVDQEARTVGLAQSFEQPNGETSVTQGSHQALPGGNQFVGWGSVPEFTEFGPDGDVRLHGSLGTGMDSYRAFKSEWTGTPIDAPAAVMRDEPDGRAIYASWNGATEVRSWRVLAGPTPEALRPVSPHVPKTGFETRAAVPGAEPFAVVEALDAFGRVIGRSAVIEPSARS